MRVGDGAITSEFNLLIAEMLLEINLGELDEASPVRKETTTSMSVVNWNVHGMPKKGMDESFNSGAGCFWDRVRAYRMEHRLKLNIIKARCASNWAETGSKGAIFSGQRGSSTVVVGHAQCDTDQIPFWEQTKKTMWNPQLQAAETDKHLLSAGDELVKSVRDRSCYEFDGWAKVTTREKGGGDGEEGTSDHPKRSTTCDRKTGETE